MNNILIDTNVLIYAKDKSSLYHSWSLKVIRENNCFVTSKNLSEYYSVVTRGVNPTLTPEEAKNDVVEFYKRFRVLFPNQSTFKRLLSLTAKYQPKGLKFHDFEIAAIAIESKVTRIATVNINDFMELKDLELVCPNLKSK